MDDSQATNPYVPSRPDGGPEPGDLPERIGRYRVERVLGHGGFGVVYLAHDEELRRPVAIKVPHRHIIARTGDAELYLAEARTVARLDHPHIVPVYDVGRTDEFPCFVVSKYIDGTDLAATLRESRLSFAAGAELVATVADALHYAHTQGLVHRDVKPGNLLLDRQRKAYVADFGLALREQDAGDGRRHAGTLAYMSPEQARGEGHRIDGRSDVFSLGVVLYRLLTGRRPFQADDERALRDQIARAEPRPPRQIDDRVPRELERICLKALARRAAERYTTAKDLADDLRALLTCSTAEEQQALRSGGPAAAAPIPAPTTAHSPVPTPASTLAPVRIVPKGLRSFDALDADFFLELLPGPRDRDGLPDSLRFWKARVEETDPDNTSPVGLIYGPSGCGKSSLVKAGLLPRLAGHVIAVHVEATAGETESRLLSALRKQCPGLPGRLGLADSLAALRRGRGLPPGQKVLIVLDQFEQWLHARPDRGDELVQALRHCDGGHVQCLILVRDDFWLAVSRFMRDLEVDLVPGRNLALADLFDPDHARKVLAAFGRAFGKLPDSPAELSREQRQFLKEAVAGLSSEGRVICVRLALFAEMMKGRPWTPASLREVGGAEGIGTAFLEETFGARAASPTHRLHERAARAVLKTLLPESGGEIKGNMRPRAELLAASGYAGRPRDFDELMRVLDGELRLLTPTDPEGSGDAPGPGGAGPYYQLTHDYLVAPLRDWLTRKQRQTRRGRAELLLAERAALWAERPQRRNLPSFLEWARLRLLTRGRDRTAPQRRMLHAADRHYLARGTLFAAAASLLLWGAGEYKARTEARHYVEMLREAKAAQVPQLLTLMGRQRERVESLVRDEFVADSEKNHRLVFALVLVHDDDRYVPLLRDEMLKAQPSDFDTIREALVPYSGQIIGFLWTELEDPNGSAERRLRAACALAKYAPPDDPRWAVYAPFVAEKLAFETELARMHWTPALAPGRDWLLPALADALERGRWAPTERHALIAIYADFARDHPEALRLLAERLPDPMPREVDADRARRYARVAAALAAMGHPERVWPLLRHSHDPTLRSHLIELLAESGITPQVLVDHLEAEVDAGIRYARILALGSYLADSAPELVPVLLRRYEKDEDGGVRGAAGWVLRTWGRKAEMDLIDARLAGKPAGDRQWFVSEQLQSFVVLKGSQEQAPRRKPGPHRFAIAATEVTVRQYQQFRPDYVPDVTTAPEPECPVSNVSWREAAAYCNKLSKLHDIPKDQWCYLELFGAIVPFPNYQDRLGYRLSTEEEWEFACRAGTRTPWSFGQADEELTGHYAWFAGNAESKGVSQTHPVATRKPNEWGLFDMHGNVGEWCQEPANPKFRRELAPGGRGGSCQNPSQNLRWDQPAILWMRDHPHPFLGFRAVRTME